MTGVDLWHFTCDHGYQGIGRRGTLVPHESPLTGDLGPVVWLTDSPWPDRDATGLTSRFLRCDRMQYRYRITDASKAMPWGAVRGGVPASVVRDLERYGDPDSWWVSSYPLPAVLA
jgi:hypothetical protein